MGAVKRGLLMSFAGALIVGAFLSSCGARSVPPAPRGSLQLQVTPPEARVYLDDRRVGSGRTLQTRPLRLRVGRHLLSVRSPGFFPHDAQVRIVADEPTELHIDLVAIPQ